MKTRCLPKFLLLLTLMLVAVVPARAVPGLSPEAEKVARKFISAFCVNDRDAISELLPRQLDKRYGPSPFAKMPVLKKARVDARMGVIEFEGGRAPGSGLPQKGLITLRQMREDGRTVWRVRQMYWYDVLPPEAGQVPDESKTDADRKQEPAVRRAAMDFLHAWMAADYRQMDKMVFHWWDVDRKPPRWVSLTSTILKSPSHSLEGLKVGFTVKLRVGGLLPKSVDGNLWLVEEDGVWRIRPLTFVFWF